MPTTRKYLIVIVNYNNYQDTLDCIASLNKAGIKNSNIVIVENASQNESLKIFSVTLPDILILPQKSNLGFSGANNAGIRFGLEKSFEYVVLLNNDTIVDSDAIPILMDEMDRHPEASLGTGQIRYYPRTNKIWYAGGRIIDWRGLAIHLHQNESIDNRTLAEDPSHVSFISGCYLCIRMSEISKLGLLNENFFLYLEDIEYCSRAVRNKLQLLYVPRSIIYHKWRGESQLKNRTLYYAVRNRNLLIDLSFPFTAKIYFNFVISLKILYWFFTNKDLFKAAKKGLSDYKNNIFGEFDGMV